MPLDEDQTCFISGKPIVDIPGQVTDLPAWLMGDEDVEILAAGKSGACYVKYLASSPLATAWAVAVRRYFAGIGYRQIHRTENYSLFMNPRTRVCTVMLDCGASFDFSAKDIVKRTADSRGNGIIWRIIEYNFSNRNQDLIRAIQSALISEGFFEVQKFAEVLQVTDSFNQCEVLVSALFIFNRSLKRYWNANSVSCNLRFPLIIPESIINAYQEMKYVK